MKSFSFGPSNRRTAWITLAVAAVVVGALMALKAPAIVQQSGDPGLPGSYQSAQVAALEKTLPSAGVQPALVVYSAPGSKTLSAGQIAELQQNAPTVFSSLGANARYAGTAVSPNGAVAVTTILITTSGNDNAVKAAVAKIRRLDGRVAPGLVVNVTGGPAFTTDLSNVFNGADTTLLIATTIVVAVLLILTYRSPILWVVPLLVVGTADLLTTQVVALVAGHVGVNVDQAAAGITSVIVFGAGTDYALLLISRYRDQLRSTSDRFAAMREAAGRTASAVLSSATTVAVSLLVLLLCATESTRAIGFSAAVGIVIAMIFGLVVLPAALVLGGSRIFWPFVPKAGSVTRIDRGNWGRVGRAASRRPGVVIVVSLLLLIALAAGSLGSTIGLSQTQQFTARPESVVGQEILANGFPAGSTEPAEIIANAGAADAVEAAAAATDGVAQVTIGRTNGTITELDVTLAAAPATAASFTTIERLRARVGAVAGANAVVGGTVAAQLDQYNAARSDELIVIPLVLLIVLVVLLILLRSVVASVLLVATVVVTFFAAMGASWLLFQNALHYPALDNGTRLLAFIFLVALGIDYNIFLSVRAREETVRLGNREGMLKALSATGGVITSAGIVLASVFAVLGVLPLVTLTQIGIIVGIGVLIDTLLVRTVLVPSLAFLLGRAFWWPSGLSKLKVSAIDAGHATPEVAA